MHKHIDFLPLPSTACPSLGADALPPTEWRYLFPNLSDSFVFNYSKLLAPDAPLGTQLSGTPLTVCVIGAGIAGTLAFRELLHAGYRADLIEATDRIGGRTWSYRAMAADRATAQLTPFEMGAMRIPFFNVKDPVKPGGGPWVGGPYHYDAELASTNSLAEMYALRYKISTAAFPDPAKAPGPPVGGVPGYPGVPSGVYLNDGWGVDLRTYYPPTTPPLWMPSVQFMYSWPVNSPTVAWPRNGVTITYYNRGAVMDVRAPVITLTHALPDDDPNIPPTFVPSDPNYTANVRAWRLGVDALRTVQYKWVMFASIFSAVVAGTPLVLDGVAVDLSGPQWLALRYNSDNWETFWREFVMPHYQNASFYDVSVAGTILPTFVGGVWQPPAEWLEGNFGGLGMNAAESQLFYTIGAGDGSWGTFYPNSALWALRGLLFGFAHQHQLILGVLNAAQTNVTAPTPSLPTPADVTYYGSNARTTLLDSIGQAFWAPQYIGVASIAESHFFSRLSGAQSAYEQTLGSAANAVFTSSKVTRIEQLSTTPGGPLAISVTWQLSNGSEMRRVYDRVICTVPIWNTQTDMRIIGFSQEQFSPTVLNALTTSHWIRSAKIFVPLVQPYWKQEQDPRTPPPNIPQVVASNTELQDMYGLVVPTGNNPFPVSGGVALLSYTWEDGAQKFLPYEERELAVMLLRRADELLSSAGLSLMSNYVVDRSFSTPGSYAVWRWSLQPQYHGCAKAYQPGIENMNFSLLTYNRDVAPISGLYFAGDAYSLESGWLEPALRLSIDAVLNLINTDPNCKMTTVGGFNFATDYKTAEPMTLEQAGATKTLGPCDCGGGDSGVQQESCCARCCSKCRRCDVA